MGQGIFLINFATLNSKKGHYNRNFFSQRRWSLRPSPRTLERFPSARPILSDCTLEGTQEVTVWGAHAVYLNAVQDTMALLTVFLNIHFQKMSNADLMNNSNLNDRRNQQRGTPLPPQGVPLGGRLRGRG